MYHGAKPGGAEEAGAEDAGAEDAGAEERGEKGAEDAGAEERGEKGVEERGEKGAEERGEGAEDAPAEGENAPVPAAIATPTPPATIRLMMIMVTVIPAKPNLLFLRSIFVTATIFFVFIKKIVEISKMAAGDAGDDFQIDLFERLEHAIRYNNVNEARSLLEANPYLRDNLNTPPPVYPPFDDGTYPRVTPLYLAVRAIWDSLGGGERWELITGWNHTDNPFEMILLLSRYGSSFLAPTSTGFLLTPLEELESIQEEIDRNPGERGLDVENYMNLNLMIDFLRPLRDREIISPVARRLVRDSVNTGLLRAGFRDVVLPTDLERRIIGFTSFGGKKRKVYVGSRGGKYILKKGKKKYLPLK